MAPALHSILFMTFLLFALLLFPAESRASFKPSALVLPVYKDETSSHVANILMRTPLLPVPFAVDLNGRLLWVNCEQNYSSSTYRTPGCHDNACRVPAVNPLTGKSVMVELGEDVFSIQSVAEGSNPGQRVTVPDFRFACVPSNLLDGPLLNYVQGVAGFGNTSIALPAQLASHFGFPPKFALCLSSRRNGAIYFGNYPYKPLPPAGHTLLKVGPEGEYYVQVRSITVDNELVVLSDTTAKKGLILALMSTIKPYTVLEHSIFTAFTRSFISQLSEKVRMSMIPPVRPFGVCVNTSNLSSTWLETGVPKVGFVLNDRNATKKVVFWANSMIEARTNISCLAFMDGGTPTSVPITIGSYQLEDNLLQFDLTRSRFGFSSPSPDFC